MSTPLLILRRDLQALLTGYLGSYTLHNGEATPAVSVRDDGEKLPAGLKVTGLELVISRQPDPDPIRQYRQEPCEERWPIWLVDWGSGLAAIAAEKVCEAFPGTQVQQVQTPERIGAPRHQLRLLLLNPTGAHPIQVPGLCVILLEDGTAMLPENCGVGP